MEVDQVFLDVILVLVGVVAVRAVVGNEPVTDVMLNKTYMLKSANISANAKYLNPNVKLGWACLCNTGHENNGQITAELF